MATRMPEPQSQDNEPTIGRLIADATADLSALIRSEIELAKSELRFSAKVGGVGAAFFAVAAFLGLIALILLSIALAFLLAKLPFIGLFLAFTIVFLLYAIAAAICALIGKRKLAQVRAPERTIATVKDDVQVFSRN